MDSRNNPPAEVLEIKSFCIWWGKELDPLKSKSEIQIGI